MSRKRERPGGEGDVLGGLALVEEAFHLLRRSPATLLLVFFGGSVPFLLYLLFFLADRSHTGEPGAEEALIAALLYVVMKVAQGHFARGLRARLGPGTDEVSAGRHAAVQLESQPWSLFVLPVTFVIGLPFGWAYAYYQSLAVTGDRVAVRRQAAAWPRQNHSAMALLALFGAFVFLNGFVLLIMLPGLLHMLLGVESAGASHPFGMLSTTTLAAAWALTYLAISPLARAVYALRCFYHDARASADDLRGELRSRRRALGLAAALGVVLALGGTAESGAAATGATPSPSARLVERPRQIDAALERVLERREFRWRLERATKPPADGFLARFVQPVFDATTRLLSRAVDALRRVADWLRRLRPRPSRPASDGGGFGWIGWTDALFAVAAILVLIAVFLLVRRLRRRPAAPVPAATEVAPLADIAVDDVAAAALPFEQWIESARSLLGRGDARGAVRAAYLAVLALLAHRELLTPARFKSNREYQREVARRSRDRPEIAVLFGDSVAAFERVWYGRDAASDELAAWSLAQVDRLRSHAS